MATNNSLKKDVATKQSGDVGTAQSLGLKGMLNAPTMKKKFEEVQGKKAPQFMTSLLNIYNGDTNLQKVDPMSVITSAMVAATLDLPIDKNLGYAWIVPYKGRAQFQLGYKGYIQLALRTGQYKSINVIEVREGELLKWNRLTEEIELDLDNNTSEKVVGYCGYFQLINGFEKTVYWTRKEIEAHKQKFSKSDFGWKKDYDAMAKKTVLRNMLSKWGILSIDMQTAVTEDEAEPRERKDVTEDESIPDIIDAPITPSDTLEAGSEVQGSMI
ncbi:recombinase RecT [Listeria monocytogenes]|uniref:recombinase RecT n=1 Tax=Listeria monocytogenes TaxID=1639 RepID=UPI000C81BC3A|nr:recombinase RecT [Listeria monocytogenes]EAE8567897.1 recombinase RecT [Listeria monocytogenes]EAF8119142.1 recombinase RecT [Listeria monocytogenes]EDO0418528.1 recombinase RecT [Listeria monocytogenes]EHF6226527.1 recombinase RecT [Listeria monocytogenes]EHF6335398.1 recombinase RecT [Listeria monocytogenes]